MSAQRFRMTYVPALGQHVPVDEELLALYERRRRDALRRWGVLEAGVVWTVILLGVVCIAISLVTP